jgi:hypothetical protein
MTPEDRVIAGIKLAVESRGGKTRKMSYEGRVGCPELWCFFPGGLLLIVEAKSLKGQLSTAQKQEIIWLEDFGFRVRVVTPMNDIMHVIDGFLIESGVDLTKGDVA